MLLRLLTGLIKGLIVGGLIGYGLAYAGFGIPGALVAYGGAAAVGVIIAMIAGKKIWQQDSRIEVAMKAVAGALLAPGLMWLSRRFLQMDVPIDPGIIPGLEALKGQSVALGTYAVTSLAMVAGVLAGFFDADNQPNENDKSAEGGKITKKRIAADDDAEAEAIAEAEEAEAEAAQQRQKS